MFLSDINRAALFVVANKAQCSFPIDSTSFFTVNDLPVPAKPVITLEHSGVIFQSLNVCVYL